MSVTLRKVRMATELYRLGVSRYTLPSLDQPAGEDPDGPTIGEVALTDPRPSPEAEAVAADLRRRLADRMLSRLNEQQKAAVGLHLAGWTHADIGRAFGFSRSRAAQVVAGAAAVLAAEDWPAPPPNPPGRPRRERTPDEELRERLVATWHALRGDGLLSDERERLEIELSELRRQIQAAEKSP